MWMCIALCGVLASATGVLSQQQLTLAKLISTNPSLSQLRDLIAANNSDLLDVTLESPAPMLTVFAPNNQAVQALARDHPGIVTNITAVRNIILNHILVNVTVKSSEIKSNLRVFSALNGPLWFHKTKEGVTVNEARVILPDQMASNGVVHVIGAVLYPFGVLSSVGEIVITEPDYSRLKPFVDRAPEVRDILFNRSRLVTVFAPTNDVLPIADAFGDTDLEAMLKRHICAENVLFAEYFGGDRRLETYHGDTLTKKMDNNVYVMNSNDLWSRVVSSGGVPTLNGAVHRINGVLGLSSGVNLVEALGLNGLTYLRHKIVFEQLDKALVELSENYTIFAPSNAAFDHFTAPEGEAMSTILRRHVIKGIVLSGEIQAEQTMQTLNREETVTVTKVQGKVYVDFQGTKATVISANKRAANGVIHFIDTVLSTAATTSAPAVFLISSLLMILLLL